MCHIPVAPPWNLQKSWLFILLWLLGVFWVCFKKWISPIFLIKSLHISVFLKTLFRVKGWCLNLSSITLWPHNFGQVIVSFNLLSTNYKATKYALCMLLPGTERGTLGDIIHMKLFVNFKTLNNSCSLYCKALFSHREVIK